MATKKLLVVSHAPSPNTRKLRDSILEGANHPDIDSVEVVVKSPLETNPEDVINCDAIILGTTENLGYMAGLTKDFLSLYVLNLKNMLLC